ncbi:hypothetical protein O181_002357 [Austropuccinia psidii MF-1]|uniref:CCHC-type domain-containing protein n=1 Tax=Austropuccinia psidii MF-1 TaxID=1389203 RepID=A0A9Q3GDW4_9BASI|nr:hypothetical protein [Austropuccinia psidii MF-1]
MQMIDEIHSIKYNIKVQLCKFDAKLTNITLDINDFKKNDRVSAELHKSTIDRLDLICNTCDRIESKCQIQDDKMGEISITNINEKLTFLKNHILTIVDNINIFATHLARSDSERQKLKDEIIAHVEKIHKNYEPTPHMPRHLAPFTEEKLSVKGSLTPFLGENAISAKDIPKLEEWSKFSGEGEYNHIDFIQTIDMLQEDFHIPDEIIVGKLHSLFTRTAKKWYYKMRQEHGRHDWSWWKPEIITKWANNSWRLKMGNAFESSIFSSEEYKPLTWFPKQKDRLFVLHPDIITRRRIGKTRTRSPIESKMVPKISKEDKRPERPVLTCHKCGSTSHLAKTCTKTTRIIEEVQCTEEKEEFAQDSAVSEETQVEEYSIENITPFFEVPEVHTHLPQYS